MMRSCKRQEVTGSCSHARVMSQSLNLVLHALVIVCNLFSVVVLCTRINTNGLNDKFRENGSPNLMNAIETCDSELHMLRQPGAKIPGKNNKKRM